MISTSALRYLFNLLKYLWPFLKEVILDRTETRKQDKLMLTVMASLFIIVLSLVADGFRIDNGYYALKIERTKLSQEVALNKRKSAAASLLNSELHKQIAIQNRLMDEYQYRYRRAERRCTRPPSENR